MLFNHLNKILKEKAVTKNSNLHSIFSYTTKQLTLLTRSKRAQSALEYMMTYGWAIIVIVVVAVILYSMGLCIPQ